MRTIEEIKELPHVTVEQVIRFRQVILEELRLRDSKITELKETIDDQEAY